MVHCRRVSNISEYGPRFSEQSLFSDTAALGAVSQLHPPGVGRVLRCRANVRPRRKDHIDFHADQLDGWFGEPINLPLRELVC
jgi:hypothetical protein